MKNILLIIWSLLTPSQTTSYGLFTSNPTDGIQTVVVSSQTNVRDTSRVTVRTDREILRLIYGGGQSGVGGGGVLSMGPSAGIGGSIGPWIDTVRFSRLYVGLPPAYVVNTIDRTYQWADSTVVSTYYSPAITFSFSKPNILEFAVDNHHAIFRTINDNIQDVWIIARYGNKMDSLHITTVPSPYCGPWPDCYYHPRIAIMPELPRMWVVDTLNNI
jgi:hypothetical protein